jgi:hypothetical protein
MSDLPPSYVDTVTRCVCTSNKVMNEAKNEAMNEWKSNEYLISPWRQSWERVFLKQNEFMIYINILVNLY